MRKSITLSVVLAASLGLSACDPAPATDEAAAVADVDLADDGTPVAPVAADADKAAAPADTSDKTEAEAEAEKK